MIPQVLFQNQRGNIEQDSWKSQPSPLHLQFDEGRFTIWETNAVIREILGDLRTQGGTCVKWEEAGNTPF